MPFIDDFDELDLTGIEIEPVELKVERLKASFGSGFGANAAVGHPSGLWGWELGSEVLADDAAYHDQIAGLPSFEYYKKFFLDHTVGDENEVFMIDFRGRKFHASFVDDAISGAMLTYDLFSLSGVKLEMRRVPGIYYRSDGSVFDPREIAGLWGWWRAEDFDSGDWVDIANVPNGIFLTPTGDITTVTADIGRPVVRLNASANTGFFDHSVSIRLYAVLMVITMREATFSNNAGILTGEGGSSAKILAGSSGTTKFANQSFGGTFQYALNGTNHAESDEQAPMPNVFGIVSITGAGIDIDGVQIGKSRTTAGTFAKLDIGEILIFAGPPSASPGIPSAVDLADLIGFFKRGWAIP